MTEYKERHKAGGGEVTYRVGDKGGQGNIQGVVAIAQTPIPRARFFLSGLERFSSPARAGRGLLGTVRQVLQSSVLAHPNPKQH